MAIKKHKQFYLDNAEEERLAMGNKDKDFISTGNVLQTAKSIVVGSEKITLDPNIGVFSNFIVRGIDTTGYSTVTVFDSDMPGFHQIRTHIDVGDTTINMTSGGRKGQEIYIKIDNDTDGDRTITFGTPFKVTGTLAGSTAASAIFHFISDETNFWEVSRTTGINQ